MDSGDAPNRWDAPQSLAVLPDALGAPAVATGTLAAIAWAGAASTLYRIRRGEGALLAINFSLVAYLGTGHQDGFASALVSVLAIGVMYAFNDLYDAPTDANNPKKDRALIATYLEHRRTCALAILAITVGSIAFAGAMLGARACLAVTAAMIANVVYSMALKGMSVVDVAWCGLWGALYATIVTSSPWLLVLVALMTAVCHLYQALDDRAADAANAIVTTAVRSVTLSRDVLVVLCALLFVVLRVPLGSVWALTAFVPLGLFWACRDPRAGWLLTKLYFGIVWLYVLGLARAAG
jgi:4-hydroxybenzoate polyprenyltransferase